MKFRATNKSAAITGLLAGLFGLLFGSRVDAGSTVWLVLAFAAIAVPPYFFVFGLRREDLVGLWFLQPSLLKRMALWFVGIICVGTLAQLVFLLGNGGAPK